jgi:hypothetical protein
MKKITELRVALLLDITFKVSCGLLTKEEATEEGNIRKEFIDRIKNINVGAK